MALTLLTWNLMHGRSVPPAGRDLLDEFARRIAGWEWDLALLQEVPPWWAGVLAARAQAEQRMVLTSRNLLLPARRAVAVRWPDLIKSNGGGANAILVRRLGIAEHRTRRMSLWPERRRLHAVRLTDGTWVGNLHAGSHASQGQAAARALLEWAAGARVALGGDFNVRDLVLPGLEPAGGRSVDQVFAGGGLVGAGSRVLERGGLSDHAPVVVRLAPGASAMRA
jgi:endonuclease/exonuclease/phosphatase family metal-dependent hydrolase